MRVALDATPLLGPRSGVGVFVAGLLGALAGRTDVEVTGFALTFRGRAGLEGVLPAGVGVAGRPVPARVVTSMWRFSDHPKFEDFGGRADVVHGTNFVVPPARRAAEVVSVHDLTPVRFPELCTPYTRTYPQLIRRALRRGAWVHVDSAFVGREVVELFDAPPERVVHVPLGIDTAGIVAADPELGRRLAGAERYVLALGTAEPRKCLPDLVRAFDLLAADDDDLALVLVGPDGWGAAELADAIERAHHRARIRRLGYLPEGDRNAVLRGAAALAYPSRYEGFGLPPLEAMAAGVPVVATNAGSLPEVLGDAATVVPVGDVDSLFVALNDVLYDERRAGRQVEKGRVRAADYTWERCADGLVELYRMAAEAG